MPAMTSEHSLQNLIETHSMARHAAILRTPRNERREAEWRCRGVGRSAWMPSERRWARDGPSARAHTTVPERRNPWEPGAVRQRKMVSPLCRNKGGRPSGRNRTKQRQNAVVVTRFKAWRFDRRRCIHARAMRSRDNDLSDTLPSRPRVARALLQKKVFAALCGHSQHQPAKVAAFNRGHSWAIYFSSR